MKLYIVHCHFDRNYYIIHMKKCALCLENEATETNTHFLTDFITKRALNENGSNERGKTLSFDKSTNNPFTTVSFKGASPEKLFEVHGRETTDEEIERSKTETDFSVDEVFCPSCEKRFGIIETGFANKFLSKMRMNASLEKASVVEFKKEVKLFRLFWLMQVWRTAICSEEVNLSSKCSEKLRKLIFEGLNTDENEVKAFPLSITLLYSGTKAEDQTANDVGYTDDKCPIVIYMNEFVIQFYEDESQIFFFDFYGLNDPDTYKSFINYKEETFRVKVMSADEKKAHQDAYNEYINMQWTRFYQQCFIDIWTSKIGYLPPYELQEEFIESLMNFKDIPLGQTLSIERVVDFTAKFIDKKVGLI